MCHCWLVQQWASGTAPHCWTSQQWHPPPAHGRIPNAFSDAFVRRKLTAPQSEQSHASSVTFDFGRNSFGPVGRKITGWKGAHRAMVKITPPHCLQVVGLLMPDTIAIRPS